MKLRIIKWKYIIDHCKNDKKIKIAFERFYEIAKEANWRKSQDIIETFNTTDLVSCKKSNNSRFVFNIGSNKYRLVTGYYFAPNRTYLYIKFVGTHAEYDKIDVCLIDMFKSK